MNKFLRLGAVTYSSFPTNMPRIEMIKTSPRLYYAIYFCSGFDLKLL
jgi:hypothetical protein